MQGTFRADTIVSDGALVLELSTFEDKALMMIRYTCLITDSCFDIRDRGERRNIESDRGTIKFPHKDLHAYGEVVDPSVDLWRWGDAGCWRVAGFHSCEHSMGFEFQMQPLREGDGYGESAAT